MRTCLFGVLLACAGLGLAACSKPADERATSSEGSIPEVSIPEVSIPEVSIPEVSIDQLERLLADKAGVPVDANGEPTRRKLGVIPGAVLLSDYETFLPSELPADRSKTLVFYCANTSCGASHEAAAKARTAGYTRVKVLPAGIAGWVKARKQVQAI